MSEGVLLGLTLLAAMGSSVVGGVFFGFSGFVMRALARLRPAQGIAAMQSINIVAVTPPLMIALLCTAAACLGLVASSLPRWREPISLLRLVGGLIYLLGSVLVTILCNVPRNNALAAINPESADGETVWRRYIPGWTAWNTVRSVAAIVAGALLTLASSRRGPSVASTGSRFAAWRTRAAQAGSGQLGVSVTSRSRTSAVSWSVLQLRSPRLSPPDLTSKGACNGLAGCGPRPISI